MTTIDPLAKPLRSSRLRLDLLGSILWRVVDGALQAIHLAPACEDLLFLNGYSQCSCVRSGVLFHHRKEGSGRSAWTSNPRSGAMFRKV